MLPAAARLRRRADFTDAVRSGVRCGGRRLVVHVAPGPARGPARDDTSEATAPRVGFVVGRAVGPAVVRNRVRRRLRHCVADRLADLSQRSPGASVVVRALPAAAEASSRELGADVERLLDRALGQLTTLRGGPA